MTKSTKVANTKNTNADVLPVGTIVVHNYGEFTHGSIVGHVGGNVYTVFFPAEMAPLVPKYQANTDEAIANRLRTITLGKGFFLSKHKTFDSVREAQLKYNKSGAALEAI